MFVRHFICLAAFVISLTAFGTLVLAAEQASVPSPAFFRGDQLDYRAPAYKGLIRSAATRLNQARAALKLQQRQQLKDGVTMMGRDIEPHQYGWIPRSALK